MGAGEAPSLDLGADFASCAWSSDLMRADSLDASDPEAASSSSFVAFAGLSSEVVEALASLDICVADCAALRGSVLSHLMMVVEKLRVNGSVETCKGARFERVPYAI